MTARATLTIKSRPKADGSVSWFLYIRPPPEGTSGLIPVRQFTRLEDRPAVEAFALPYRKALAKGLSEPQPETVAEFFKRWNAARRKKSPQQADADEAAFRLHVSAELGALPIEGITRERLIEFSHRLDTVAAKGEAFGEKRARNIFSTVAAMFRDAHTSKDRTLRVLASNPMADVPWPERSKRQALKQMLFPAEFMALVSCPDVPIVRARLYAVTLYTMTRAAEVRVLEAHHFDLRHGSVQVLGSADPTKPGATKSTKGGKSRLVTLEPNLAPVIAAMIKGTSGRLFPDRPADTPKGNQWQPATEEYIPPPDGAYGLAGTFKRDLRAALKWAGIKERPELFDDSNRKASLSIRFHDLRASGITWRHARRDNPTAILQECGHEDQATNEIYIRALRGLAASDIFPVLPVRLVNGVNRKSKSAEKMVGAEGLEFASSAYFAEDSHKRVNGTLAQKHPKTEVDDKPRDGSHARVLALATAIEVFLDGGMVDHVRPLVRELVVLLREADGRPIADVIPLAVRR